MSPLPAVPVAEQADLPVGGCAGVVLGRGGRRRGQQRGAHEKEEALAEGHGCSW